MNKRLHILLASMALLALPCEFASAGQRAIVNNTESPHAVLRGIDIGDCRWTSGFWGDKWRLCEEVMVPHMGKILKGDVGHAYDNFKIAAGLKKGEHKGTWWHDGDFYKWMEAACYIYAVNRDPAILRELDEIIEVIGKAQAPDGYLSTGVMIKGVERFEQRGRHELYNAGHLMTAACIHYRVTGQRNFLSIAIKNADYLYKLFQPRPARLARFGYNPTHITGLVELYRTTRDPRYLELAGIFIDMRGTRKGEGMDAVAIRAMGDMVQDRVPLRKESEAVGHAVLAMYLYAGAADFFAETGDDELLQALERIWSNVVERKMYITGAIGQGHHGASSRKDLVHEAFLTEYMMPNSTAYNETCANVCNAMFNWRMLGIRGESRFADVMETVLYNSALSGISADGTCYFYTNPLRRTHDHQMDTTDYPTRTPWIPCFCCPPNLVRTIAKSAAWAYSLTDNGIAVNLYGGNELDTTMVDGSRVRLRQETEYPWKGRVTITIDECRDSAFEIWLRIPAWASEARVSVNGREADARAEPGKFAVVSRRWRAGDVVTLDLPMEPELLRGNPRIEEVRNQAAIRRGPVDYCLESADLPKGTDILDVYLPSDVRLRPVYRSDLLGGVAVLQGEVLVAEDRPEGMYYQLREPEWKTVATEFVPYYAWSNRGVGEMTVWLPIVWR